MNLKKMQLVLKGLKEIRKNENFVKKFNMNQWGVLPEKEDRKKSKPNLTCATQACAIGSLVLAKKIPGLTYSIDDNMIEIHDNWGETGYDAVQSVLDIDYDTVHFLFDPEYYSGKEHGSKGIDEVIKRVEGVIEIHSLAKKIGLPEGTYIT